MSSIGARSAEIYVMEKRQKEKLKRMEEERGGRGEVRGEERKVVGSSSVGKNKVHPGSEHDNSTGAYKTLTHLHQYPYPFLQLYTVFCLALWFSKMNSMRNLFITGVVLFLGFSVPEYFREYTSKALHGPTLRRAGWFDDFLNTIFLSSPTVAMMVAVFLDNTLDYRIVPKKGECHGGPSSEHLMELAGMKNSIRYLSTSTGFSLHGRN
ncbi:hypothetical protein VNO78_28356 [Psophocarpus tetragonolobus]|uniref:Uncharacterized protein n=1 Tax=Psophocarpus tetragonolobus TaxID=3891 RepID=A0AAN9S1L0_PSOTE